MREQWKILGVALAVCGLCGCKGESDQATKPAAPAATTAPLASAAAIDEASATPAQETHPEAQVSCGQIAGAEPPGPQGARDPILEAKRGNILARGSKAPEIILEDTEGQLVNVQALLRQGKIVVIELGSITCPVFRSKVERTNQLQATLGDKAVVFYVYTQEAHPSGSPSPYQDYADKYVPAASRHPATEWSAPYQGKTVPQPSTYAERVAIAKRAKTELKIAPRVLVDRMDNAVWKGFGSISNGGFVITPDGTVRESQVWFGADGVANAVAKCSVK